MHTDNPVLDFRGLTPEEIREHLQRHQLALSVEEALLIQNTILNRPPTLAECHLWSIQGSEHCSYKSSRKHLQELPTDAPNVILGPKEDAGIVAVATDNNGRRYGIAISHESHNHPSQIVPYEGAATGVGGNLRDVSCMGAEVISLADGLRFGSLKHSKTPWIYEGVTAGIGDYGNATGIPNIAGDLYFDEAYNENCLVTVVTLGIVREDHILHSYAPSNAAGFVYILVGKATDNSGFGGASFASATLIHENQTKNKGAVQEPNAFLKRHLLKANQALFYKLQEQELIHQVGFKDLGAGGVACATVEMAEASGFGAEIDVEKIPASMTDLPPHVLLCAETQERFMWVVPPSLAPLILTHYNNEFALPEISQGACAAIVGHIRADKKYVVKHYGKTIIEANACDITRGIVYNRDITPQVTTFTEPALNHEDMNKILLHLLAHENIASRQPVLETYDKQVQGRTFTEAGESDAGILSPFNEDKYPEEIRRVGIALSLDQNPRYNKIDPYWGAVNAVLESARNVAAVGATPQAITDCLCFGNPENPQQMWQFTESIRGIRDACHALGLKDFPGAPLPVIAGNVSFYNETHNEPIPPSPMISCLGSIPDVHQAVTSHLQRKDSLLLLIGARKNECGGSVFYQLYQELGAHLPKPDLALAAAEIEAVIDLIRLGLVLSAHDISDGGTAVALAEMSFKQSIGLEISIPGTLPDEVKLFGESGGFILEVLPASLPVVNKLLNERNIPFWQIGKTTPEPFLKMQNQINIPISIAKERWENGLREKLL